MIIYKRVSNKVLPFWVNKVTGKLEPLTYKQIIQGGDCTGTSSFNIRDVEFNYSRLGWEPYFIQRVNSYVNPRTMKSDGSRITDNDWFYQD